jgi:acyl-coenzyme A synthetase/AMP-(fatty) acid ligase/SAM-dependent methyltransferase/acyl carrier protein
VNASEATRAFDGKAAAYARHRRDYSPVAIDAIIAIAGLGKASVIADLGAGTGMLTRHFAERVGCVFAIEPNDDMRSFALASLGRRESLRMMKGTAQETGLPDHSVDAVTAGRAIQWFEPAPAQAEIRRILRPGGWLIVVRTPVTDAYSSAALERLRDERISRADRSRGHHPPQADVDDYLGGDNYIRLAYPCAAQETWPEFLGRMQSLSFSPQPGEAKYDGFERVAREIFDGGAVDGVLRVEYATEVLMKQIAPPAPTPGSLPFLDTEIERDIVTRFEHVVAVVPDRIALKADGETWTYAQLDSLANRIAETVLRDSPDRSKPVALLFDHGIGGVASIMGVLKAGRAYCAISPAHPAERHRETLVDLQSALLLCAGSLLGMARNIAPERVQCAAIDPRDMHGSDQRPDIDRSADDIAAIYYTSGTTGRPKGVMLSHRCVLHRVWLSAATMEIAPGDPLSQIAEISFVTAAADVFVALLTGATICPFDARRNSLRQMATWLNRDRIAIVRMPVALFHQFLDSLDETDRFPHVRFIQPSGKLLWNGVDRYRKHFDRECRLVRQLAATETWAVATMMVDHDTPPIGATVPVGYPVPGKVVWLENESGAPVAVGEVGEIVVRSKYLYSGLWGRPETLLPRGQARVHRMGDLGRWLPDGSLEFVGRIDSRVKIRGFTVDLEQVEAAIGDTGLVIDATVVVNEGELQQTHLVAYFVPANPRVTPGEIRAVLTERMPVYMVPSRFVALDALPLTPNGKIDRAALPNPGRGHREPAKTLVAPRTPMETSVRAIWIDVLKIDPLGIDDDFLELGGDSLIAARIAGRLLAAFQVDLTPRDLFDAPTIARMAELILRRQRESRGQEER